MVVPPLVTFSCSPAADREVAHIGDAARVIAGYREPLAVAFEGRSRGGFAAPRR